MTKIRAETINGIRNSSKENQRNVQLINEAYAVNKKQYELERQRQRLLKYGIKEEGSKEADKLLSRTFLSKIFFF